MKKTIFLFYLILTLIAAGIVYSPALRYPFVWDDLEVVRDNAFLRAPVSPLLFFQPHFWKQMLPISRIDYRPLQMLALRAIALLGGRGPLPYHLMNILLHLLVCFLIWRVVGCFSRGPVLPFFTAVFFAFHPVHVETVVNARNISELLAAVFILLAFLSFIRRSSGWLTLISLFFFILALLCKESSLIFPLLLTAYLLFRKGEERRSTGLMRTIPFWLASAAGATAKIMMGSVGIGENHPRLTQVIPAGAKLLVIYFRLLAFPVHLQVLYPFFKPARLAREEWFFFLIAAAALLLLGFSLRKYGRLSYWAFLSLLITLLPALTKIGQRGRIVAEQRLYFPSFFFCLLGAIFFEKIAASGRRPFSRIVIGSFLIVCLAFAGLSREYLHSWRSDFALWNRVTALSPRSALAHNNLGAVFHRRGDEERALAELKKAVRIQPDHKEAHNNLGVMHRKYGRWEEAISEFEKSLKENPDYYPALLNLTEVYLRISRLKEAEETIRQVIDHNPYLPRAYNALGIVLEKKGKEARAREAYLKAAQLNPEYAVPLRNLAVSFLDAGEHEEAIKTAREAIRRKPFQPAGYLVLSRVYVSRGELDQARAQLSEALRLEPKNWRIKSRLWALETYRRSE